jgi:nitrite reductase/ring-hydroxylating ferredoxin subunit
MTEDAPRLTSTPAGVALGPLSQIADGKARAFVLELRAGRFHGFVVRQGDEVHGYVDRCPHMGLPLAQVLDDYVTKSASCARGTARCSRFRTGAASVGRARAGG